MKSYVAERRLLILLLKRSLDAVKAWQQEQEITHPEMVDGWKLEADIEATIRQLELQAALDKAKGDKP